MSPMNPRLMRPLAAGNRLSVFATAGYTRLWAVTTQSGGDITGSAETDTGYYAVKWWDNTVDIYDSGDPFSKAALGNQRAFEVYPCDIAGVPGGQFDGFDLSDNSLTQVRSEGVTLASSGGALTGGYAPYGYWWWGPYFSPIVAENGIISDNLLSAEALDQFYTDLDAGTGSLFVDGNPGIDADDPTIATAKGYTVFGSVPPGTALLLNFNGTNGSTTFTDSSPNGFAVTATGGAELSTSVKKYGTASGNFTGSGSRASVDLTGTDTFSDGDFTIEFWVYPDASASNQFARFVQRGDFPTAGGWAISRNGNSSPMTLLLETYSPGGYLLTGGSLTDNQWSHVAVTRQGNTYRLFVDGVLANQNTATASLTDGLIDIGANSTGGESLSAYIDDLRILKGIALYTANFTPPASELEVYP